MSLADRLAECFRSGEPFPFEFISRRCLRNRLQGNTCSRCIDECPVQAIRSGEEMVLPCLGALAEEHLAAFSAKAVQGVGLRLVKCSDCRAAAVPDLLARRLATLNNRLGNKENTGSIRLLLQEEESEALAELSSRRAFFKAFREISFHAATETMAALQADPNPKEQHAHKHQPERLAQLRRVIIDIVDPGIRQSLLRLFFTLTVSDECNFCGACAGMCPTGALKNKREEGVRQLLFDWARCSGCGLCLELCRKKALTLVVGRSLESLDSEMETLLEAATE